MSQTELSIRGVRITAKSIFTDDRGAIRHMLRETDEEFDRFGEIYFSLCKPRVVKGWHLHKRMTLNYLVVLGSAMVGLIDGRPSSPTFGLKMRVWMDTAENHFLLTIPPGIWNGYRAVEGSESAVIMANCATHAHDPGEIVRCHPDAFESATGFKFDWGERILAG